MNLGGKIKMDIQYLLFLQNIRESSGEWLTTFFSFMTNILEDWRMYIWLGIVYWGICKEQGTLAIMNYAGGGLLYQTLKNTFCIYRPFMRDERIVPVGDPSGYSFPSGHSTYATGIFGTYVRWQWREKRKWLAVLLGVVIALVMFSRNFLGAHTPQDVLVACVLTSILVVINAKILEYIDKHPERDWVMVLIGLAIVAVQMLYCTLKSYPVDYNSEGEVLVTASKAIGNAYIPAGAVVGFLIGWILERRFIRFTVDGHWIARVIRVVLGIVGIWALNTYTYAPLKSLLGSNWGKFASMFLYCFYVTAIWPFCFKSVRTIGAKFAKRT